VVRDRSDDPHTRLPFDRPYWIALTLITCLAAVLRLWGLDSRSLWGDEINMIDFARGARDMSLSGGNAIGYLPVISAISVISNTDWALRLPAALAGTASIPLTALLGRMLLGSWTGIGAAALLAVAPMHVVMSQQVHAYALFTSVLIVAAMFWAAGVHTASRRAGVGFGFFAAVALHLHQFAVFVVAPIVLAWLIGVWTRRRWVREYAGYASWKWMLVAAAVFLVVAGPYAAIWTAPQIAGMLGVGDEGVNEHFELSPRFELGWSLVPTITGDLISWRGWWPLVTVAVWGLAAVGAVWILFRRRIPALALVLWVGLPPLPIVVFSHAARLQVGTHRLIMILPPLLLLASYGIFETLAAAGRHWRWGPRIRSVSLACGGLAIATVMVAMLNGPMSQWRRFEYPDLRAAAAVVRGEATENDLVLVFRPHHIQRYGCGEAPMFHVTDVRNDFRRLAADRSRVFYVRPGNVDTRPHLRAVTDWVESLGGFRFATGGGLVVTVAPLQPEARSEWRFTKSRILALAARERPHDEALAVAAGEAAIDATDGDTRVGGTK